MIGIKIISLSFSMMFSSPTIENTSNNRYEELTLRTKHIEISKVYERNNGVSSNGESFRLSYKTWRGTSTEIEHHRNTKSDINIQTILTKYWIFGNQILYQDWFGGKPKYLNWIGFKHNFKRLTIDLSYATDFESERFSKMNSEISYLKKLRGNWYFSPSFKRRAIWENSNKKSDWRFTFDFKWLKK